MAYVGYNLSVLAYANNFTLWHYTTEDKLDLVTGAGYFSPSNEMLRVGDLLIVCVGPEGEKETKFMIVTGNDGINVTISVY